MSDEPKNSQCKQAGYCACDEGACWIDKLAKGLNVPMEPEETFRSRLYQACVDAPSPTLRRSQNALSVQNARLRKGAKAAETAMLELRALPDDFDRQAEDDMDAGYWAGMTDAANQIRAILKKHGLEGGK